MLADARAILAELEQDLACSTAVSLTAGTGGLGGTPDFDNIAGLARTTRGEVASDAEVAAPFALSFYRKKCLELVSQVQRRDTEVIELRRALSEARTNAAVAVAAAGAGGTGDMDAQPNG